MGASGAVGLAQADVVVVVSAKSATKTLSIEEVSDIFLGKSAAMTPIDNADKSGIRGNFYLKVTGKSESQVKAVWSRIMFTGRGRPPREMQSDDEVVKAVAADPTAIGYVDKTMADASVKVVSAIK